MITGDELAAARSRANLTQDELAQRMDVSLRTVGNWERVGVPRNKEARLRDVLPMGPDARDDGLLTSASNYALVAEILRRLDQGTIEGVEGNVEAQAPQNTDAGVTSAQEEVARTVGRKSIPKTVTKAARHAKSSKDDD